MGKTKSLTIRLPEILIEELKMDFPFYVQAKLRAKETEGLTFSDFVRNILEVRNDPKEIYRKASGTKPSK